jgi:hypothetical protein
LYRGEQTFGHDLSDVRYKGAMRGVTRPLLIAVSAAALVGCGSDVDVELVWGGPPDAAPGGVVSTDGFAGFQQDVDEAWERSPAMAAAVFLRLDERKAVSTTIDAKAGPEGGGDQIVVVTLDGIPDDSVRTERWTLGFEDADGVYTLTAALREVRCQRDRGHQDFSADDCV